MKRGIFLQVEEDLDVIVGIFPAVADSKKILLAGTQFWVEKLENELAGGRLSGTTFERSCKPLPQRDDISDVSSRSSKGRQSRSIDFYRVVTVIFISNDCSVSGACVRIWLGYEFCTVVGLG
ncbi:hypothetical protein Dimus_011242 [Dionaea muscipula]